LRLESLGDIVHRAGEERKDRRRAFARHSTFWREEQVDGKIKTFVLNRIKLPLKYIRHPNRE